MAGRPFPQRTHDGHRPYHPRRWLACVLQEDYKEKGASRSSPNAPLLLLCVPFSPMKPTASGRGLFQKAILNDNVCKHNRNHGKQFDQDID